MSSVSIRWTLVPRLNIRVVPPHGIPELVLSGRLRHRGRVVITPTSRRDWYWGVTVTCPSTRAIMIRALDTLPQPANV